MNRRQLLRRRRGRRPAASGLRRHPHAVEGPRLRGLRRPLLPGPALGQAALHPLLRGRAGRVPTEVRARGPSRPGSAAEAGRRQGLAAGPGLCTMLSAAPDATLDDIILAVRDAETRVLPTYKASQYWDQENWDLVLAGRRRPAGGAGRPARRGLPGVPPPLHAAQARPQDRRPLRRGWRPWTSSPSRSASIGPQAGPRHRDRPAVVLRAARHPHPGPAVPGATWTIRTS